MHRSLTVPEKFLLVFKYRCKAYAELAEAGFKIFNAC